MTAREGGNLERRGTGDDPSPKEVLAAAERGLLCP